MTTRGEWPCNCPICRVLALPLMGKKRDKGGGEVVSQEREAREEPQDAGQASELRELKDLVEALRESVVELKSALSELSNPFNMMRKPGKEEDEESSSSEPLVPLSASQSISPSPVHAMMPHTLKEERETKPAWSEREAEGRASGKEREALEEEGKGDGGRIEEAMEAAREAYTQLQGLEERTGGRINLARLIRIMYMIRRKAPKDNLESMIEILDMVRIIPSDMKEVMLKVADLVEKARESGISPERQLILLYALAKASGAYDGALEEEAMSYILEMLDGGEDWERQQS
ncbi:MAG: hypothetical protein LRS43_00335 [Desulfurococcales archaeon]|nr:hypothetical protein [Desulfurococcales archaeon]